MSNLITKALKFVDGLKGEEIIEKAEIQLRHQKQLDINTDLVDVELFVDEKADAIMVKLLTYEKGPELKTSVTQELINITAKKPEKYVSYTLNIMNKSKLSIAIPQYLFSDLVITTNSGDIRFAEVEASRYQCKTSSGNMKISQIQGHALHMTASSGNIDIESVDMATASLKLSSGECHVSRFKGDLDIQSKSGGIEITTLNGETLKCQSSSGDIKLKDIHCLTGKMKSGSGKIVLHDMNLSDCTFETSSGGAVFEGTSPKISGNAHSGNLKIILKQMSDVELHSSSGSVRVTYPPELVNSHCKIMTGSGSITINHPLTYIRKQNNHHFEGIIGEELYKLNIRTSSGNVTID